MREEEKDKRTRIGGTKKLLAGRAGGGGISAMKTFEKRTLEKPVSKITQTREGGV